jgi:hypothetical protein
MSVSEDPPPDDTCVSCGGREANRCLRLASLSGARHAGRPCIWCWPRSRPAKRHAKAALMTMFRARVLLLSERGRRELFEAT